MTSSEHSFIVYKTTNTVNGKIYVGVHKNNGPPDHFDGYLGSGVVLRQAIQKYGESKFVRETISECDSWESALDLEYDIVNEEFVLREDTYNVSVGGRQSRKDGFETNKGTVRVFDTQEQRNKRVKVEEYTENKERYIHSNLGKTAVVDSDGNKFLVNVDDERIGVSLHSPHLGTKIKPESIAKALVTRHANGGYAKGEDHHLYGVGIGQEAIDRMTATLKRRHQEGLKVWNDGLKLSDITTKEERKKYGRNTSGDKNPAYGRVWVSLNGVFKYPKKFSDEYHLLKSIGYTDDNSRCKTTAGKKWMYNDSLQIMRMCNINECEILLKEGYVYGFRKEYKKH
jgi:hypothetical protein